MKKEILRMDHVYVRKSGRYILEDFHLNVLEGEFLFVYGFSDSGIRELGEVLKGTREVSKGTFYVEDKKVSSTSFSNPGQHGIYIVQNEDNLIDDFSIAENLFFGGNKKLFNTVVSRSKQEMMAKRLLKEFGFDVDVRTKVRNVDYFFKIVLKIIMAYARGAKCVVFDSMISMDIFESGNMNLLKALEILREDNVAVLWLNQKVDYARELADRIVVLQKGKNIRTLFKGYDDAFDKMLLENSYIQKKPLKDTGNEEENDVFEIKNLSVGHLKNCSMSVQSGEMVCVSSYNVEAIRDWRNVVCAERRDFEGSMFLEGRPYRPKSYAECVEKSVIFLDLMWYEKHCNPNMSIADNMLIDYYWNRNGMHGVVDKAVREFFVTNYKIKHPGWPTGRWSNLSTDQQKMLLLEKAALTPHKVVILTEPFFQINAAMVKEFLRLIDGIKETSKAVILAAGSDSECLKLADRVIFLNE